MCTENNSRPGIRNSSNSLVDNSALFYGCTEPTNRNATCIQCFRSESGSSNPGRSSSPTPTTAVDGMQVIRRSLQESEISPDTVDIIMHSWRDSTQKQYKVYINKWLQFCSERKNDPLHPTVTVVLFFSAQSFQEWLELFCVEYSSVCGLDMSDSDAPSHTPIGKHFLVCRYLKGVFNRLKPVPKYNNIWSVDTVLDYLSLFWPLHEINLKELALKLVMLIALTTGQRCQTLTFLDTSEQYMQKNNTCFNFALTEHLKQDKPGKVFGNVRLYKYPVRELCVYEILDYYLQATEKLRNSSKLLVSYIKPYKAVTSSTIGRWIKTLLGQAGVDTEIFSGHSTRCASTSKALMSVSTDVILATAAWTEESTFWKFYNKPVAVTVLT